MSQKKITKNKRAIKVIINLMILIVLELMAMVLLNNVLEINNVEQIKYAEVGNLDYKVYLKENEFYEKDYLDKNMEYISSLIKNVAIDIDYKLIAPIGVETKYKILGNLVIYNESGNNVLYEKKYLIMQEEKDNEDIKKEIKINYDYYNNIANSFKSTYKVDTESKLEIKVIIEKSIGEVDNGISELSLVIPLSQKTVVIKSGNKTIDKDGFVEKKLPLKQEDKINIAALAMTGIVFLLLLIRTMYLLLFIKPIESKYDKQLKKILMEYDRMIIETETLPNFKEYNIIEIKKFEELLDVRDNLKTPIVYYNLKENHQAYFYIKQNEDCYLYILKATDVEEK